MKSGLDEAQAGIKISQRNINNLRYADDTILLAERKEDLKSLLMRVKEESEKAGLKLSIQKTKNMATSPLTSLQNDEEKMETVTHFIFLSSQITADYDYTHEIKRCLLLRRKAMTNLDSIKKQRCHFADKGPYRQMNGFSSRHVQIWDLEHKEGWMPKNWCFWTMVLKKTLKSLLDFQEVEPVNSQGDQ